ncbi:hypothetical protein KEM56_001653 [Ascosphaera pollenicola]|nr:hypothetical protein KEM56_001653 [Ascosphaera pollenicola]
MIQQRITEVHQSKSHVKSIALYNDELPGTAESWLDFDSLAVTNWQEFHHTLQKKKNTHKDLTSPMLCGDEAAVVCHYIATALVPLNGVATALNWDMSWSTAGIINYGLYATRQPSSHSRSPDLVLANEKGVLRMVGEVKSPWSHELKDWWEAAINGPGEMGENCPEFEKLLETGQLSAYMDIYMTSLGFVTNGDHTVFVRRILRGSEIVYCFSRPVADEDEMDDECTSVRGGLFLMMAESLALEENVE